MTDEERMIQALREYWFDLGEPLSSWPESEFKRVAYSRWAVDEILRLMWENSNWSVLKATEEFKSAIQPKVHESTYRVEVKQIFEIAYGAAVDISDILIAMI